MGVVSYINDKTVCTKLCEVVRYPKMVQGVELLAPPLTKHYVLLGIAVDYLIRFYISKLNAQVWHNSWTAFTALDTLERKREFETLDKAKSIVSDAEKHYIKYFYADNFDVTDMFLKSILLLSKLDIIEFTRKIEPTFNLFEFEQQDIDDLRKMYSLLKPEDWKVNQRFLLNNFFSAWSLTDGAEVDVVLDKMLLDIKATKKFF